MGRILVVDDDGANLFLMEQLLGRAGFRVQTLDDPTAVLDVVLADPPELILLDVMMPVLDGISVLRSIREHEALDTVPVIMVTARGDSSLLDTALAAGANDYVRKPVDHVELMARIRSALKLKQYADELRKLEQLKVVREMVVAVSHNFNQPITAMRTYLAMLEQSMVSERTCTGVVELISRLKSSLNEMVELISRLRRLSRYRSVPYLDDTSMVSLDTENLAPDWEPVQGEGKPGSDGD